MGMGIAMGMDIHTHTHTHRYPHSQPTVRGHTHADAYPQLGLPATHCQPPSVCSAHHTVLVIASKSSVLTSICSGLACCSVHPAWLAPPTCCQLLVLSTSLSASLPATRAWLYKSALSLLSLPVLPSQHLPHLIIWSCLVPCLSVVIIHLACLMPLYSLPSVCPLYPS